MSPRFRAPRFRTSQCHSDSRVYLIANPAKIPLASHVIEAMTMMENPLHPEGHRRGEGEVVMTMLDTRQREALDDSGYIVLQDVVDAHTLAALRETFERAAAEQKEAGARQGGTPHVSFAFHARDYPVP